MSDSKSKTAPEKGDLAPDFVLFTHDEEPWRLSGQQSQPVVLLFFPGAFTSVCTAELRSVNTEFDTFGEAQVVGISTDSPFVLSQFQSVHGFGFPLLSDHDASVSAKYGAKYQQNFTHMKLDRIAKRAAFVIDRAGKVQYAEVLDDAGQHPDFQAVQSTLHQLSS